MSIGIEGPCGERGKGTKAATDVTIYAQRKLIAKKTTKGESGSSAMPQKANPFYAESCETLTDIANSTFPAIKKAIVAYRTQGDLRRSTAKREGFHPLQLSIIAMNRLVGELNKYEPHIVGIEKEVAAIVIEERFEDRKKYMNPVQKLFLQQLILTLGNVELKMHMMQLKLL